MSDLEALGDHECGDGCLPYVPLLYQELEDLEESEHIDALYALLERTREHAALLTLALARAETDVRVPARTAALLLDLDEMELDCELGHAPNHAPEEIVAYAIEAQGSDGYVGKAMEALFRLELGADEEPDDEDDDTEE
jgi:hypothetical protein